ncbi:MAG: exodeoxyribonuclease III, partial [Gammaproteobacteria bacterium]
MKIATWNVNSIRVRLEQVIQWLQTHQPDVLALQETKVEDQHFPASSFSEIGYHAVYSGQKTYNGVALISKAPLSEVCMTTPELSDPSMEIGEKRFIAATLGNTRLVNLYVVNGQEVGSPKYEYKLAWLDRIRSWLQQQLQQYSRLIVVGDFNIAPEDRDVYDPEAWRERILCSTPERDALQKIQALGLEDAFRQLDPSDGSYSWWDYRAAGFRRNRGLRIDLILASSNLSCRACEIDKEPR